MKEQWKKIKNYEKKYLISNIGNVYSIESKKLRKSSLDKDGYPFVVLHDQTNNKKPLKKFIHTLILENFVRDRKPGEIVRHYPNQDKTVNCLENLSWSTPAQNARDRKEENHSNTVLNEEMVLEIKDLLLNQNYTQADIHRKFKISRQCICNIVSNKSWKDVGPNLSNLNFDKRTCLTEVEVSQIKMLILLNQYNNETIANYYNINIITLRKIKNGEMWNSVKPCDESNIPKNLKYIKSYDERRRKIQKSEYEKIKKMSENGLTISNISNIYNVDRKTIYVILKN